VKRAVVVGPKIYGDADAGRGKIATVERQLAKCPKRYLGACEPVSGSPIRSVAGSAEDLLPPNTVVLWV
jgi:hypothetical protein